MEMCHARAFPCGRHLFIPPHPDHAAAVHSPCDCVLQGAIEVQDLVVRYRADLDPVLKGISFSVRGREKVRLACRLG